MNARLAIQGGCPVRTTPFLVEPLVDEEEEIMVLAAIRAKNFSRYIGSTSPDIESILRLKSAEARNLQSYWSFLGGENVRQFAANFAEMFDVPFAIPVNSATSGLSVALAANGLGPGDEVIVPAISYTATASSVLMFNSIPVFVDVDPETFCIDPAKIEAAIGPRTKAILPVHLTGNLADMDRIMAIANTYGIRVIEDAAQAIGAKWHGRCAGTIGNAGVFSFQQSKNIMTGEGGMIVTHDPEIAKKCRLIINHGEVVFDKNSAAEDLANMVGCNFRMPELCAAIGIPQLKKLERLNTWRTNNADTLRKHLSDIPGLRIPRSQHDLENGAEPVPHLFVALYSEIETGVSRDIFVAALRAEGIPIGTGYSRPMYKNANFLRHLAFGSAGCPWRCRRDGEQDPTPPDYHEGMCPVAENLIDNQFLWFYHIAYASTEADMQQIITAVKKVCSHLSELRTMRLDDIRQWTQHDSGRIGSQQGPAPAKHE